MEITLYLVWQVVCFLCMFVFCGFALVVAFMTSEINNIKRVIAVILGANPSLAKKVEFFTKKESILGEDTTENNEEEK